MKGSQVLKEALTKVLSDRRSIWWHLILLTLGPLFLVLSWPEKSLTQFLEQSSGPNTFSIVIQMYAIFIFASGGDFTLDRIPREAGYAIIRWIRYTPVGTFSYLQARVRFHFVHSVLMAFLALPSLILAGAGSLSSPLSVLSAAAFLAFISFCQRVATEAGRRSDRTTGSLGYLIYFLVLLSFMLLTFATFPEWNPLSVLRNISVNGGEELTRSSLIKTSTLHLFLALSGFSISAWRLSFAARVVRAS